MPGTNATIHYQRRPAGLHCLFDDYTLALTWYGADVLRVQAWRQAPPSRASLSVIAEPAAPDGWNLREDAYGLLVQGPKLSARIDADGTVRFLRGERPLVAQKPRALRFTANDLPNPEDRQGVEQGFQLQDDEALYGLGQFMGGAMNWRGREATLIHGNVTVVVPFLVSTRGWGLLWDNASHTTFRDGADGMTLWSEVADGLDYYLCAGASMDDAIAGYRHLTGAAPLFPRAFYGFIQCKERYKTAEELVEVVREHRRRKLPLDVIVQDWLYWGPSMDRWSGMRHDHETYGDLAGAVKAIHEQHARVMISIWPRIGIETPLGRELAEKGHLFAGRASDPQKVYDAFSPEAREIYWRHVREGLFDLGIDAWWMDGTEPEFEDCHNQQRHKASLLAQRDTAAGSWARVLNAFSLATTRGVYENQRATDAHKRVFILTRSAFAGQQHYGAATWSGDVSANWRTFADQIPAGLNFCLAGIPYWTTDNGAFFVRGRGGVFPRGVADPAFREFFLRWFQYSCFCPLMRSHGTQTPREIWQFGAPGQTVYDTLAAFDGLRMRLLPYSYSLAAMTTFDGYTPMRALAMDWPDDDKTHGIADQFTYGPALMACPVTHPVFNAPGEAIRPFVADDLVMPDGTPGAVRRRIFDGLDATAPAWEDKQINIDYSWSGNRPRGATGDEYRVEITGKLRVPDTDAALRMMIAGRIRVDVDGQRLLDEWTDAPARELRVDLAAFGGRAVPLQITYGHATGDSVVLVGWETRTTGLDSTTGPQSRPVYLPHGTWYDFWTGERIEGGRSLTMPAPLERIPVLAPEGAVLPLGPHKQWQDACPDDPIEVRIYPGADGAFTLYEDEGDGYAYERGACSHIPIRWNDATQTLTLDAREGAFPGMPGRRSVHVVLVRDGHGCGIDAEAQPDAVIPYDGEACRWQKGT